MLHQRDQTRSDESSSRSVAHGIGSGGNRSRGIALPAVPAFPLQKATAERLPAGQSAGVMQLQALIADKPYERPALAKLLEEMVNKFNNRILADIVRYSLIPFLENEVYRFKDMDAFYKEVGGYLQVMNEHIFIIEKGELSELIQHEIAFQKAVKGNPLLAATLTTCGFEFEFLQATEDSVLAGISHVDLALSKEEFDFTKSPFKVETDSACVLELVTPAFLLPTLGTAAFPHPALIDCINNKFKGGLLPLQKLAHALSTKAEEGEETGLQGLLGLLSRLLGINFALEPEKIGPQNVSYNVGEKGKLAVQLGLTPEALKAITFKENNEKYAARKIDIAAQINFASSAEVLGTLLAKRVMKDDAVYLPLYAEWHRYFTSQAPELPPDYVEHLLQKLVSLYAVPLQELVLAELNKIYLLMRAGKQLPGEEDQRNFSILANYVSYVKDIKPIWVKDDLANITKAYLRSGKVVNIMKDFQITDFPYKVLEDSIFERTFPELVINVNIAYKDLCDKAFALLRTVCKQPYPEIPPKEVGFLEHSTTQIGGRQDTYIHLNELARAIGEDRRYVGEVRDGDSALLWELAKEIMQEEEGNYKENYSIKEGQTAELQAQALKYYKQSYKNIPEEVQDEDIDLDPLAAFQDNDGLLPLLSDDIPKKEKAPKSKKTKKETRDRRGKKDKQKKDKPKKDKEKSKSSSQQSDIQQSDTQGKGGDDDV
jgi:hypothetical protein